MNTLELIGRKRLFNEDINGLTMKYKENFIVSS